ncbi:MAG: glycosyl hydrolase [Kiritimatiellae bacterium]|nr:glycosyl hydrolase [Kiritimatiellia bacterium]
MGEHHTSSGRILLTSWDGSVKHAAEECRRLGLRFTMQNCPGWAMSGGPWIAPSNAMRHLVWSHTIVDEKSTKSIQLPQPQPSKEDWRDYREVAVIAFPTPDGDSNQALSFETACGDVFPGDILEYYKYADVLWYVGDEQDHKPMQGAPFPAGYRYDYCNSDALLNRLSVKDGCLVTPEGISYRLLWMPDCRRMLPETLERIVELVKQGAKVVGEAPKGLATLSGGEISQVRFEKAVRTLWPANPSQPGFFRRLLGYWSIINVPFGSNQSGALP